MSFRASGGGLRIGATRNLIRLANVDKPIEQDFSSYLVGNDILGIVLHQPPIMQSILQHSYFKLGFIAIARQFFYPGAFVAKHEFKHPNPCRAFWIAILIPAEFGVINLKMFGKFCQKKVYFYIVDIQVEVDTGVGVQGSRINAVNLVAVTVINYKIF